MTARSMAHTLVAATAALVVALSTTSTPTHAHKAITSKYYYNEDLFPLFKAHCGQCHVEGGVAPMSLLTYDDAAPWGESLRLELLGEETKPWHAWRLTPRELDTILVWSTGGSPKGDASKTPPPVVLVNEWASGEPDVTLAMPKPFTLAGPENEATHEVVWQSGPPYVGKTLRAVDLRPGQPAMVRLATLALKTANGTSTPLGTWVPGRPEAISLAKPITVPAGASVVATIEYRRTWKYEGQPLTDASAVGLYLAGASTARARGGQ